MGETADRCGRPCAGRQVGRQRRHDRRQGGEQGRSRQGGEPGPSRPGGPDYLRNSRVPSGGWVQMSG